MVIGRMNEVIGLTGFSSGLLYFAKRNGTKQNGTKRNGTKRNEKSVLCKMKWNETK